MKNTRKSIPKLIRRFVGIMLLSVMLLVILNLVFFVVVFVRNTSSFSPWDMADEAAAILQLTDQGFWLPDDMAARLKERNAWAILIDEETHQVIWHTDNLPDHIPLKYTLSDITDLTRGYVM